MLLVPSLHRGSLLSRDQKVDEQKFDGLSQPA